MAILQIDPPELARRLALPEGERPVLLDVRSPEEHAYVALPGSLLVPLYEFAERKEELQALAGRDVVVYCHLGVRSLDGAAYLINLGARAASLRGGIEAWADQVDPSIPRY